MRKEWLSYGIPAALLLALVVLSLKREETTSLSAQPTPGPDKLVILPAEPARQDPKRDEAAHVKRIAGMRARFKAGLDYGVNYVVPARAPDKSFLFGLSYVAKNLGCKAGDLDLITKAMPTGGGLLLTVDADDGADPVLTKAMTLESLRKPFSFQLKIPSPEKAKVYRLTLCSDIRDHGDCKSAVPAPMDEIEAKRAGAVLKENLIFYAQTFVVDANGIKFLDNLRHDLGKKDVDPANAFGSHLSDSPYLKQVARLNAVVKPIPTSFAANALNLSMSYRDMEACKALGGGK